METQLIRKLGFLDVYWFFNCYSSIAARLFDSDARVRATSTIAH